MESQDAREKFFYSKSISTKDLNKKMKSSYINLLEAKKNQIEEVFRNNDFKVGLEFEFYNEKFLEDSNRPSAEETLLLGTLSDLLTGAKKKNRNILNNNRNVEKNKRNKIITDDDILNDFQSRERSILLGLFKRQGFNEKTVADYIYYIVAQAGSRFKELYYPQNYKQDVFDRVKRQLRKLEKFMDLVNAQTDENVPFADVRKFYKQERNLPPFIKNPLISPSYRATAKANRWAIVLDQSVSPALGGIEMVSPVMRPQEALEVTDKMFNYIRNVGNTKSMSSADEFEESDPDYDEKDMQCGLHINISFTPERMKKFDALKFLLFSHESQVNNEKLFGRRKEAEFIDGMLEAIKDNYYLTARRLNLRTPEALGKWLDEKVKKNNMKKGISLLISTLQLFDKYANINYSHYKFSNRSIRRAGSERIEIRYFGGEGYEDKIMTFRRVLGELLYALDVATDPEKEKDRYYKKVYKLLNNIEKFDKEKPKRK